MIAAFISWMERRRIRKHAKEMYTVLRFASQMRNMPSSAYEQGLLFRDIVDNDINKILNKVQAGK